tara:strand:+ start:215 stop:1213 length:999 start_codon:yes stop_codon:yes gene_type:complete
MKKLDFLLIPRSNYYLDIIQISSIQKELNRFGHNTKVLTGPVNEEILKWILEQEHFDIVFQVNKPKSHLHKRFVNTRFISWMNNFDQIKNEKDNFSENDIIYVLDKNKNDDFKKNILEFFPAVDENEILLRDLPLNSNLNYSQSKDISLISNETFLSIYGAMGNMLKEKFKEITNKYDKMLGCFLGLKCNFEFNFFGLVRPSEKIMSNKCFQFLGNIKNYNLLFEIFKLSKINMLSEISSFDFNTNFFKILSVQGLILLNKNTKIYKKLTNLEFKENQHFICFKDSKELEIILNSFLNNKQKRIEIGINARKFLLEKHTYKHRVKQMLIDLR